MVRNLLLLFGSIVAVLPYLGFPHRFDDIISTVCGVGIVLLVLLARKKSSRKKSAHVEYVTHAPADELPLVAPHPDVPVLVRYEEESEEYHPPMHRPPHAADPDDVPPAFSELPPLPPLEEVDTESNKPTRKRRSKVIEKLLSEDDVPPAHVPMPTQFIEAERKAPTRTPRRRTRAKTVISEESYS